jgi:hypothetical protein
MLFLVGQISQSRGLATHFIIRLSHLETKPVLTALIAGLLFRETCCE